MGKGGDLWDDSALITAFDDAISNYKVMHAKGRHDDSPQEEKVISNSEENLSALGDDSSEGKRHVEADEKNNVTSNHTIEKGDTTDPSLVTENPCLDSSNAQDMQDVHKSYSNTQGAENYSHLTNQYYELEEQRQKVLQQLYQFGDWNHEGSDPSTQWGTPQENQVPAAQASCPTGVYYCCSYACPGSMAACASLPACPCGGSCVNKTCNATSATGHKEKSSSPEDGALIKMAMGAAEKALSTLKTIDPDVSDGNKDREQEVETNATDLSVVLNAWYSAGFYTGKYLTEQSFVKK